MKQKQIYRELARYPSVFRINGDFVTFKSDSYKFIPNAKRIVDEITSSKNNTLLTTDEGLFSKSKMNKDLRELKVLLVENQISDTNCGLDLVYGDILWANTNDHKETKLVFNWKKYIKVIGGKQ